MRFSSPAQELMVILRCLQLPDVGKVKIAYLGKVLKEGETLMAQGWQEGHVVNALVF